MAGNQYTPSGGGQFDVNKLFKPSTAPSPPIVVSPNSPNPNSQNLNTSNAAVQPNLMPSNFPPPSASYPPPTPYSPQAPPFHHHQPPQFHNPQSIYGNTPSNNIEFVNGIPQRSLSYPTPPLQPQIQIPSSSHLHNFQNSPNVQNPNLHGARLMALLSAPAEIIQQPMPQMPQIAPTSSAGSDFSVQQNMTALPSGQGVVMARMPSSKVPKGRHLVGDHSAYDIDVRLPGEVQPQLEVTPITKYGSDPGLVVGRQIAVNKTYICYGLKLGAIRVLNINTALRSLLKGLAQRVTDMVFFAEDVHLLASASVDGRVYVWKITEGPDDEDKPQIAGKIVVALQITGEGDSVHPRVCWHCHKQEVLVVGIGKRVLKIDTTKVGKGKQFSAEEPVRFSINELIDGVQHVGNHDGEVTDLSMCQWMTTRLVSASVDGTIKIWEDRKSQPIAVLRPHDGQPVNSATFLAAPHRPDHIILITGGPLNREVKIWVSASEEGWLLPSDAESWLCTQSLEFKSSTESRLGEAFFNQILALSQSGLLLLANAKRNAMYAVHLEYGSNPASTRMDYIAEFTVTMPILSFTGTSQFLPQGEQIIQVYCVQTQAIQQYALELSRCLPPPLGNTAQFDRSESSVSRDAASSENLEGSTSKPTEISVSGSEAPPKQSLNDNVLEKIAPVPEFVPSPPAVVPNDSDISSPLPLSPRLSRKLSGFRAPQSSFEEPKIVEYSVDRSDSALLEDDLGNGENQISGDDISMSINPPIEFKHPTHLVTPSEILMANSSSSEMHDANEPKSESDSSVQDVEMNNDVRNEVEVKVVGETTRFGQNNDIGSSQEELHALDTENKEKSFCSQASDLGIEMARESLPVSPETYTIEESTPIHEGEIVTKNSTVEEVDSAKDFSKVIDSAVPIPAQPQPTPNAKGKKHKGKSGQGSGMSSSSVASAFNSTDSLNEPGVSSSVPLETAFSQISSMQEMMSQLVSVQKEMQKQMTMMVSVPIAKEGKRLETALGRGMEKAVKSNSDALWARFQEENAKQEKASRERTQQVTNMINSFVNKDLPAIIEKSVKKELTAVGQAVARTLTPTIEKTISTCIVESFQRGVGDKATNQLEKAVNSKLENTVARQIQTQFQTLGKQALQETLKSSLEGSVIPAFEMSCRAMFDQVDATFKKGMIEHTTAAQQQLEASHSPLALTLRDAINSASSMTQTLSGELLDGQRKLLALTVAGANSKSANPLLSQLTNGPLAGLHEKIEVPLDPTKELSRLIAERKYEEAFTAALQRSDVSIVSWLCSQVDLPGILSLNPLPLSQGVLLSLLQQLACDISTDTPRKLNWMREVLTSINPADPMILVHVRPILEQVYQILNHHRNVPTASGAEISSIRLIMHVLNSLLMSSK